MSMSIGRFLLFTLYQIRIAHMYKLTHAFSTRSVHAPTVRIEWLSHACIIQKTIAYIFY